MKDGLTVDTLLTEVRRRSESKRDYSIYTKDLVFGLRPELEQAISAALSGGPGPQRIITTNGHTSTGLAVVEKKPILVPTLNVPKLQVTLGINGLAHDQLATHLGIPARYYDKMLAEQPELLAHNVNTWLQAAPRTEKRLVRALDGNARAFLSSSYNTLDNWDLLRFIMPLFRRELIDGEWKAVDTRTHPGTTPFTTTFDPDSGFWVAKDAQGRTVKDVLVALREPDGSPMNVQFRSCDVTDNALYVKVVCPTIQGEVKKGDVVRAGVIIKNSEVGLGSLAVWPFYERLTCTNGAFITEWGDGSGEKAGISRRHVGGRDGANVYSHGVGADARLRDATKRINDEGFFLSAADTIQQLLTTTRFNQLLEPMREAAGYQITGHPQAAIEEVGKVMNLTDTELDEVTASFMRGNDMTIWGLSNAITDASKQAPNYDRATELEGIGGRVLTLSKGAWKAIAEAKVPARKGTGVGR